MTEIVVTPRTSLGQLIVAQRDVFRGRCSWGADINYCQHVRSGTSGTTVIVESRGGIIGRSRGVESGNVAARR